MTDIVERLRLVHEHNSRGIFKDAADEIERLRAALTDAVEWCERHGKEPHWLDFAIAALSQTKGE